MADIWVKTDDTAPSAVAVLKDYSGAAVDLTSATVRFIMRPIRGGAVVIDDVANNEQIGDGSDGTKGLVSYTWMEGDTVAPGGYLAEFEVTYQDMSKETFPNAGYLTVAMVADLNVETS